MVQTIREKEEAWEHLGTVGDNAFNLNVVTRKNAEMFKKKFGETGEQCHLKVKNLQQQYISVQ